MATLYYWSYSSKASCGHLSLGLKDSTYLSFWPKDGVEGMWDTVQGTFIKDLKTDKELEGRNPDEIVKIPDTNINVSKVKAFITKIKQKGAEYRFLLSNCAQMVQQALIEGEMTLPVTDITVSLTPYQVMQWAKSCKPLKAPQIDIGNVVPGPLGAALSIVTNLFGKK